MEIKAKVVFTTQIPSPYQVELFNALASTHAMDFTVIYEQRTSVDRQWGVPDIQHHCWFLQEQDASAIEEALINCDLAVFSGYRNKDIRRLIHLCSSTGKPWAFWGERPGFKIPASWGKFYRRLVFPELFKTNAAIWGIGQWAVDGYRSELRRTEKRLYLNVPYFSDLSRFMKIQRSQSEERPRKILFSGSLIKRKGIDLLIAAFKEISREYSELELHLIGDGPMRDHLVASSVSVSGRVIFHGFKQWTELPEYYAACDILCAPSRYDGWGLVVPEGLAAGLLVVSADHTGAALDLITPDVGWIAEADSQTSLSLALRAALNTSGGERVKRIASGRMSAAQHNVDEGVRRIMSAVRETLSASSK